MNFEQLIDAFKDKGCTELYAKVLSDNDNSKNQIYLGSDFKAINIIPYRSIDTGVKNYKAKLEFYWLDDTAKTHKAPNTRIILYPQYPEVRFSGFLKSCKNPPSKIMTGRQEGRLLFLGVKDDDTVIGFAVIKDDPIAKEFYKLKSLEQTGIFHNLTARLIKKDSKKESAEASKDTPKNSPLQWMSQKM